MAEAAFTLKLSPRLFWGGEKCFGPGIAELLEGVDREGSLRAAACGMGMAYSKAWTALRRCEETLKVPLLERKTGGRSGRIPEAGAPSHTGGKRPGGCVQPGVGSLSHPIGMKGCGGKISVKGRLPLGISQGSLLFSAPDRSEGGGNGQKGYDAFVPV